MLAFISLICIWLLLSVLLRTSSNGFVFHPEPSYNNLELIDFEQIYVDGVGGNKISVHKYESISEVATDKVILYLHGNAGPISSFMEHLTKAGTVYSPSYPGYGDSEGNPSQDGSYDAAMVTYNYLVNDLKIDEKKITIFGHSLGGSVSTYLASQKPNAAKLVLANTFSSIQSMCFRQYSILCIFSYDLFNSAENAKKVKIPVTQFALKTDKTIPFQEGEKLYSYFNPSTSSFVELNKFTHSNLDWDLILPAL